MDKEDVIINSVKKLIALDLTDQEIIENLKDVGIENDKAKQIIAKARGKPLETQVKEEVKEDEGTVLRKVAEDLADAQDEKTVPIPTPNFSSAPAPSSTPSSHLSKLWEKGIITTVNQRLNEMKQLKREIDGEIEERTREVAEKEVKKIQMLLESKTTLMSEKVNAELQAKESEVVQTINLKIGELKAISKGLDTKLDNLKHDSQDGKKSLDEMKLQFAEFKKMKEELSSQMNRERLESKEQVKKFLDESASKMNELDERVSKTLELEQEVIDGILDDAKHNIKEIGYSIKDELKGEIDAEVKKLDELKTEFGPDKIKERVKQITAHRQEIREQVMADIDKILEKKQKEAMKPIEDKFKEVEKLQKEIQKGNQKAEELKKIQSQILEKMHTDIKSAKSEVAGYIKKGEEKLKEMDKQVTDAMALQSQLTENLTATPDKETLRELKAQMKEMQHHKEEILKVKEQMESLLEKTSISGVKIKGLAQLEDKLISRYDSIVSQQLKNKQSEFMEDVGSQVKGMQELRNSVVTEIKKEVQLPKIKTQMEELEIFKDQFINVIDRNVEKFNLKIKKFNESTKMMDDLFQKRLEAMDRKLEELDRFEKAFSKEMSVIIDKLSKAK